MDCMSMPPYAVSNAEERLGIRFAVHVSWPGVAAFCVRRQRMTKRRQLLIFLGLPMAVMLMAILAPMWAGPPKASAIVSFTHYTNVLDRPRKAGFRITNSGSTSIRLRYGTIFQADSSNSVGAHLCTDPHLADAHFPIDPKQASVFFVVPPESPGRWQLHVVYLKEGRRVR